MIVFKKISKNFDIGDSRSKSSHLLLEQLRAFSIEIGQKFRHKKILDHLQYMFVETRRNLYNTLAKNDFVNMLKNKNRFTVLNDDEIVAGEVKKFPCLYDKSSHSYLDRGVVKNAWVEVAGKL